MVKFDIIDNLEIEGPKYEVGRYIGNSLWLADDTTIISSSAENLKKNIGILRISAKKKGLEISEEKSKIILVGGQKQQEKIDNFEVVKSVKYLGVRLGGRGRNVFGKEKKLWVKNTQVHAARLRAKIRKSYDMVTIGKTIWKQIMVTEFMFGKAVISMTRSNIRKVQAVENSVYRYLMGVGGYAMIAALRGEIDASRMKTRAMETTLMYLKDMLGSSF